MYLSSSLAEAVSLKGDLEFKYNWTYNNLVYKSFINGQRDEDHFMQEDLNNGPGYYLEGVYYAKDNLGVGLGFDQVTTNWFRKSQSINGTRFSEYSYNLSGPHLSIGYKVNDNIIIDSNLIYYNYKEHYNRRYSWNDEIIDRDQERGDGLGFIIGVELNKDINDKFSINLRSAYRQAHIKIREVYSNYYENIIVNPDDEVLQINGLQVSGGVSYRF